MIESSWRHRFGFYIDATGLGRKWELLDAILNVLFCILYIVNTLFPKDGMPFAYQLADFVLAMLLLVQYLPRAYLAVDFVRMLLTPLTLLTLISTIPVFLAFLDTSPSVEHSYMSAGNYVFVYPFRFLRLHQAIMLCLVLGSPNGGLND